jgi:hypothetical protein
LLDRIYPMRRRRRKVVKCRFTEHKSSFRESKNLDLFCVYELLAVFRFFHSCYREVPVKQLIAYLLDHAMLDFSGELTIDMVKEFLRDEEAPAARALLNKIMQDGGVEEMQIALADCLQDSLRTGLTEVAVGEQLKLYSES